MTMKTRLIVILTAVGTALMGAASAATVVFDDFSSGAYSIAFPGIGNDNSEIDSLFADRRLAGGNGLGNWSSTVDIDAGVFTYTLEIPRMDPGPNEWFTLSYRNSQGNMSLLGYDAFVIHVESVIGTGQIMAYVGTGGPSPSVISVSLVEGDLIIPFANMAATNPENPSAINFQIIPQDPDFSVTISGIGVIPEPSTAAIAGLGAVLLVARRHRRKQ